MTKKPKKKCLHKSTFGTIGAKNYFCSDCRQKVENKTWKQDLAALKKAERSLLKK